MKNKKIKALPISLRLREKSYDLVTRITDGPQVMLDRIVTIQLTSSNLNAIEGWNPDGERKVLYFNE